MLRKVPMLRPLPVPAIEQLAQNADAIELAAGETLFHAGDSGDQFFVVVDGEVEILDGDARVRTMGSRRGVRRDRPARSHHPHDDRARDGRRRTSSPSPPTDFLPAVTSISAARSAAEVAREAHLRHAPGSDGRA